MKGKYLFFGIFFILGFFVALEYGEVINKKASQAKETVVDYIEDQRLMNRAEKLKKKAENGVNRFSKYFNKKVNSIKKSVNQNKKKLPQTFWAYGTDHFDPSSNAFCVLHDYDKINGKIRLKTECSGNYKLQKQVAMDIKQKVRKGEL